MLDKKQLTVRLPVQIIDYLTMKAKNEDKALNEVVTDITEEHMQWHKGERALEDIAVIREQAKNEYGIHPDSTEEIRKLRDGDR